MLKTSLLENVYLEIVSLWIYFHSKVKDDLIQYAAVLQHKMLLCVMHFMHDLLIVCPECIKCFNPKKENTKK